LGFGKSHKPWFCLCWKAVDGPVHHSAKKATTLPKKCFFYLEIVDAQYVIEEKASYQYIYLGLLISPAILGRTLIIRCYIVR
jgi:hypothetical protein